MLKIIERHAQGAFSSEDVAILIRAFDACWDRFLQSGARFGSDRAMELARERLAKGIIESAKAGERDPQRLCEDALLHMTQTARRPASLK
jgi:hypothetical protein